MVDDFVLSFFRHLILHLFVISVLGSHLFAFIFAFCWHWFGICFAYVLGIVFAFVWHVLVILGYAPKGRKLFVGTINQTRFMIHLWICWGNSKQSPYPLEDVYITMGPNHHICEENSRTFYSHGFNSYEANCQRVSSTKSHHKLP